MSILHQAWLLGSNNAKKSAEMRDILQSFGVELNTLKEAQISLDVEEWAQSFEHNAALKALQFAQHYGGVAIADDSGLCVEGLDGKPGVFSARFAGPHASDEDNNQKLQEELRAKPEASRKAAYHSVIAIAAPEHCDDPVIQRLEQFAPVQQIQTLEEIQNNGAYLITDALAAQLGVPSQRMNLWLFQGAWEGEIADIARGNAGFGYDPWFLLSDGRHVAELENQEKNQRSHRAQALQKLAQTLRGKNR